MSDYLENLKAALRLKGIDTDAVRDGELMTGNMTLQLNAADVVNLIREAEAKRSNEGPADVFRTAVRTAIGANRMPDSVLLEKIKMLRAALDADGATLDVLSQNDAGYVVAARWRDQYAAVLKAGCDLLDIPHTIRAGRAGIPAGHAELATKVIEGSKLVVDLTYQLMRSGYGGANVGLFARIKLLLDLAEKAKAAVPAPVASDGGLTFEGFRVANEKRCYAFKHGGPKDWSKERWGLAAAGEVGEMCNAIKKQIRGDGNDDASVMLEAADAVTYIDLLVTSYGWRLEDALRLKFNRVSEKVGSPITL